MTALASIGCHRAMSRPTFLGARTIAQKEPAAFSPRLLETDPAKRDADLGPIRNSPSFQEIVKSLKR